MWHDVLIYVGVVFAVAVATFAIDALLTIVESIVNSDWSDY